MAEIELVHANQGTRGAMKINAGLASRLRTQRKEAKLAYNQTEHPNALPASWHCSGQRKGVVSRVCFTSARPVHFRSGMRPCQLCRTQGSLASINGNRQIEMPAAAMANIQLQPDFGRASLARNANKFSKICFCRSSGSHLPLSQERIKAVAIPIFNAKWPGVRFFSIRLTRIQSPSACVFVCNGLHSFRWLDLCPKRMETFRCAIPNRATLLQEREFGGGARLRPPA